MTRLWEENKPLILVMGAGLLLLIVIRPTIFGLGPPLARWMGSGWKARYDELEVRNDQLKKSLGEFYPQKGEPLAETETRAKAGNLRLKENFDEHVHALAFLPYEPFRMPRDGSEPGFRFLDVLGQTRDQLLIYCSLRSTGQDINVDKGLGFEEFREGKAPASGRVEGLLRRLAVTETFVKLCADNQIRLTQIVRHLPRRDIGGTGRKFLREYPVRVKLKAGYCELTDLLAALNGVRGRVRRAPWNESKGLVEEVTLDIGRADGVRRDQSFTIFKRSAAKPCDLAYAGRVTVTNVRETEADARVEEASLPYGRLDTTEEREMRIRVGDGATTGFFRVSAIDVHARPGRVESTDSEGVPTKVTPNMLDVSMEVCTIDFQPATEYVTVKNADKNVVVRAIGDPPQGARGADAPKPAPTAGRPW